MLQSTLYSIGTINDSSAAESHRHCSGGQGPKTAWYSAGILAASSDGKVTWSGLCFPISSADLFCTAECIYRVYVKSTKYMFTVYMCLLRILETELG